MSFSFVDFILVDNWERLSKDNFDEMMQLLWDKQLIFTKVNNSKFNIETA